jgi:ABC-type Fe3+/spermidine/putrescine transport system ATPase subunit
MDVASFIGTTNAIDGVITESKAELRVCDTPVGPIHAQVNGDAPTSGSCAVCFRPEAVRIATDAESPNRFHAKLVDRVFHGDAIELCLAVGNVRLRATVVERPSSEKLADADDVACFVDPRDIVLLKK